MRLLVRLLSGLLEACRSRLLSPLPCLSLSLLGLIKEFVAIISRAISTNGYRGKAQTGSPKYIKKKERGREGGGRSRRVSVLNKREVEEKRERERV